jgi:hypothetical protein
VRKTYLEHLDQVTEGLVAMSRLAADGVRGASTAVVGTDIGAADDVIAGDAAVNDLCRSVDELALDLLARQQPVAPTCAASSPRCGSRPTSSVPGTTPSASRRSPAGVIRLSCPMSSRHGARDGGAGRAHPGSGR